MMASFDYNYQNPSLFLFFYVNWGNCYLNPTGNSKFKQQRKNERNSGSFSQMTTTCKSAICHAICHVPSKKCGFVLPHFYCRNVCCISLIPSEWTKLVIMLITCILYCDAGPGC